MKIRVKGFDVVFSNIPYGQTTNYGNTYPVPSSQGDSIFIQFIIKMLAKDGMCAVIVPEGLLYRSEHKSFREYLIQECDLQAVISLPSGVFYPYAGVKTDILVFKKGTTTESVWFYNVENDGFELSAKRKKITQDDLPDALTKFLTKETSEKSFRVLRKTIETNHFRLNFPSYFQNKTGNVAFKPPAQVLEEINKIELQIGKELEVLNKMMR